MVASGKVSLLKATEENFRMVRADWPLSEKNYGPVTLVPLRMVAAKDLCNGKFGVITVANSGRLHYYIARYDFVLSALVVEDAIPAPSSLDGYIIVRH